MVHGMVQGVRGIDAFLAGRPGEGRRNPVFRVYTIMG